MQDPQNYFSEIITGFITSLSTAGITWFYSRQRQAKEVEALEIDLVERAVKIWREMSEELKKRVDEQGLQIEVLQSENGNLRLKITTLERDNESQSKKIKAFIKKYGE